MSLVGFYTDEKKRIRPITKRRIKLVRIPKSENIILKKEKEEIYDSVIMDSFGRVITNYKTNKPKYLQSVFIKTEGDKIKVESPYHPKFVNEAKRLGGKWSGSSWVFPSSLIEEVKKVCMNIYGEDGTKPAEVVDIKIHGEVLDAEGTKYMYSPSRIADIWLKNKRILKDLHKKGKNEAGVAVIESSGNLNDFRNLKLIITDYPKVFAEELKSKYPEKVEIMVRT